jgi:hypothetical protein
MSNICDSFERTCVKEFGFLITDYELKMTNVEKEAYGCYVTYNNGVVAVEVSYDIKDGGLFVMLCRMVNGQLPPQEVFVRSETVLNRFDLEDVVSLKEPSIDLEQNFADPHRPTVKELETNLRMYAEALKTYAKDILGGDFSSFADLEKVVKRRANVLKE